MTEEWKDVIGFESYYQVSNLGRIKSKGKEATDYEYKRTERIMKPSLNNKGYLQAGFYVNKLQFRVLVHRLVGIHFVDNPFNFDCVNHMDNNPLNNAATNLRWDTMAGNIQHAVVQGRFIGKQIVDRESGRRYRSISEAARLLNMKRDRLRYLIEFKGPKSTTLSFTK